MFNYWAIGLGNCGPHTKGSYGVDKGNKKNYDI